MSRTIEVQIEGRASSRIVWKFPFGMPNKTGRVFIDVPVHAEFLSVALQGEDEPVLWALVDPLAADETPPEVRRLIVVNTGMEVPGFPVNARFLGTFTTSNGVVWHVWDGDA